MPKLMCIHFPTLFTSTTVANLILTLLLLISGCDTAAAQTLSTVFQLHMDATEVTGTTNGSTVTPSTAPAGFTGKVVVNSGGSVNYAPGQVGNGAYFLNCCANNDAYYKFSGSTIGN